MILQHRSLTRVVVAFVSFVVAALITSVAPFPTSSAHADEAGPALDFNGFIHLSDLSCGENCTLGSNFKVVGVDPTRGEAVFYEVVSRTLLTVDTTTLQQTGFVRTGFIEQAGAVDDVNHRVFLGSSVRDPNCDVVGLLCAAGPTASGAQVATVDLGSKTTSLYTLPSAFDGYRVISLTAAHPSPDHTILYALAFLDDAAQTSEPHSSLTLIALDPDKLDDNRPTDAQSALLWSWPIPSCGSTPSYALSSSMPDYLGIDPAGHFAYFACRGFFAVAAQMTQPGAVVVDFPSAFPTGSSTDGFRTTFYPYGADVRQAVSGGDAPANLLYIASLGALDKVYVFNAEHRAWTGSVPFPTNGDSNLWGLPTDPATGRVYVLQNHDSVFGIQADQVPAPQGGALALGDLRTTGAKGGVVDPVTHRLFIPVSGQFTHRDSSNYPMDDKIAVYTDSRPPVEPDTGDDPDAQTHDIPVADDTPVTYGSFASAYGAKAIAVGGEHSTPIGQSTPGGGTPAGTAGFACDVKLALEQAFGQESPFPCLTLPSTSDGNRALTFGQVANTEVSNSAAKSNSSQLSVDQGSNADSSAITSYNIADDLWGQFVTRDGDPPSKSAAPVFDPVNNAASSGRAGFEQQSAPASCSDFGDTKDEKTTPGAYCVSDNSQQQAGASAAAPDAFATSPIQIGYAGSATSVTHTVDNAAVATAKAVARNVTIAVPSGPTVTIGEITATAASTAAGRPNTATSTFSREISDVVVRGPDGQPAFSCGFADAQVPQCDPRQLTDVVSSLSPSPVLFLTPERDLSPSTSGSPGGAQAEVIKDKYQYWNDYNTLADDGVEVPALQIILVGDTTQPSRIVMELAAVHVESHDAIGLPPPPLPPLPNPSLGIGLVDGAAAPLAGGQFALLGTDGSTVASCTTGADGVGDCAFTDMTPGSYTIRETKAPPGYKAADDFPVSLEAGQDYLAVFVNLEAIGSVAVNLTSAVDQSPIEGGQFALYAGKSTLGSPIDACTTDKNGSCAFTKVPLGDYTMQQKSAPKGFLVSDDYAFSLTDPGQEATLNFVDGTPAVKAKPARYIPGKPAVAPHTEVVGGMPAITPAAYSADAPVVSSQPTDEAPVVAGLPSRIANLPAQLARLLTHSPQQAVLLLFMWLVLGLPVYLWARRRQLLTAIEGA